MPLPRFNAPNLGIAPSASEVIAKHLRDAIISGQFAEDEPIRQDDIAGLFNVSKIPVREALKRLEAEGLLTRTRSSADERVVELRLTEKGRSLQQQAERFPACILEASGQTLEQINALRDQIVALRDQLQKSL